MRIEDRFAKNEIAFNNKFNVNNDKKSDQKIESVNFGDVLKEYIDDTNLKSVESSEATSKFARGDDINIDEVMIKGEEASLSLQFLTQTRDKLVEGYKELTRMQL